MNEKTLSFIEKSNKTHNNFYDYSKSEYISSKKKLIIICPEHGEFNQSPEKHLSGQGCKLCGFKKRNLNNHKSQAEILKSIQDIHQNKYDYSLVNYKDARTKVKVICPEHGIFEILVGNLKTGQGCPKCWNERRNLAKRLDKDEYIDKVNELHNNFYDYSLVNYTGLQHNIKIICPEHGIFEQLAGNHLYCTQGCPKCGDESSALKQSFKTDDIIIKLKELEPTYDYSLVEYKNMKTKIKIICSKHNIFEVRPYNFIFGGSRCPKCSSKTSKGEKEVLEYVKSIYIDEIIENDRKQISPYELDIYLPDIKLGIEFNGTYWHKLHEKRIPGYHELKKTLCKNKNIDLIMIAEKDWTDNSDLIKLSINKKLTKNEY